MSINPYTPIGIMDSSKLQNTSGRPQNKQPDGERYHANAEYITTTKK